MNAPTIHRAEARLGIVVPKLIGVRNGRPIWEVRGGATGTSISDYLENKLLDHTMRNTAYTSPTTVYAALYTATPSDTGGGTEVSGGSYARTSITCGAAASGAISNSSAVNFPTASGSWGTVTHCGVFDASSAGNLLYWGALTASKTVASGDTFSFAIAALSVALD